MITDNTASGGSPAGGGIYSLAYGNKITTGAATSASVVISSSTLTGNIGMGGTEDDLDVKALKGRHKNTSTERIVPGLLIGAPASGHAASAMGAPARERTLGALKGTTAQRLPVSLTAVQFLPAKHYYGRAIRFKARLTCTENGIRSQMTGGPFIVDVKPDRQGKFSSSSSFEADDFPAHASVSGQIGNHLASGTLRITTTLYASSVPNGIPCDSGRVRWKASGPA